MPIQGLCHTQHALKEAEEAGASLYEQTWSLKAFEVSAKPAEKKKSSEKRKRNKKKERSEHSVRGFRKACREGGKKERLEKRAGSSPR